MTTLSSQRGVRLAPAVGWLSEGPSEDPGGGSDLPPGWAKEEKGLK